MIASLFLAAALSQSPETPVTLVTPDPNCRSCFELRLVAAPGVEVGSSGWAGPLSPNGSGPRQSAPSLSVGLEFTGDSRAVFLRRISHLFFTIDASQWMGPAGGGLLGVGFGGRLDLLETRVRPFLGWGMALRGGSVPTASRVETGVWRDIMPSAGVETSLGTTHLRLEVGPHFLLLGDTAFQWWHAQLAVSVPL